MHHQELFPPQLQWCMTTHPLSLCGWEIGRSQNIDIFDDFLQVWVSEGIHERIRECSLCFLTPCLCECLFLQRCRHLEVQVKRVRIFMQKWVQSLLMRQTLIENLKKIYYFSQKYNEYFSFKVFII